MKVHIVTQGIVLARTNFQEADRIVTVLTPDHGKLRIMAKGVRRPKSKLAGGIELFSVSELSVMQGRGEIQTLVSARMIQHFVHIPTDINRTMLGYQFIKTINRTTEDAASEEYYELLYRALIGLNTPALGLPLLEVWFNMQLLKISGTNPNLTTNEHGEKLLVSDTFIFDHETMAFTAHQQGQYDVNCIKFMRLVAASTEPQRLMMITAAHSYTDTCLQLTNTLISSTLRK